MSVEQKRNEWRIAGVSISALLLLILVLYQHTVLYLAGLWNKLHFGEYGHGYIVLAISVFLIVRNRRRLISMIPCPSYRALPAVIAASLLWLAAAMVNVNMMETVALLLLVLTIVWTVLGKQVTVALVFPILFIGFAIPIWFPLSPLMQDLTANVVFWIIRLLEVPAFRQENMIIVPAGTLSVEEACSGLRYFLAALTLGTLYAYMNYQTLRARLIVVFISAAAAVLANLVRVFIVVYLGYATDMQHPLVHDHLMLGWYLFGGLVIFLLMIDARIYRHFQRDSRDNESDKNITEDKCSGPIACAKGSLQYIAVIVIAGLFLSVGPAAAYKISHQPNIENSHVELEMADSVGSWIKQNDSNDDWMPVYHGAINRKQVYQRYSDKITLYVGYYLGQKQGAELINNLNRISNEKTWRTVYPRARLKNGIDHQVLEQLLENSDGKQRLVWYWYSVSDRITTDKYEAKILQVLGLLKGAHQASVTAVSTELKGDPQIARKTLREFVLEAGQAKVWVVDSNI